MKKLFVVTSKLLGILLLYRAIRMIVQMGVGLGSLSRTTPESLTLASWWLTATIVCEVLTFLFAFLLLFRTEMIARMLRINDDNDIPQFPSAESITHMGAILIALNVLLLAIPDLAQHLILMGKYGHPFKDFNNLVQLLTGLLKVAMAVWILRNPNKIVSLMAKQNSISQFQAAESIIRAGAILIGVNVLLLGIPDIASDLILMRKYGHPFGTFDEWARLLAELLKVAIAVWILRNQDKFVSFIIKPNSVEPAA